MYKIMFYALSYRYVGIDPT